MTVEFKFKQSPLPSNKTILDQKNPLNANPEPVQSPDKAPRPFIDKLAITLTITSASIAEEMHGTMYTAMTYGDEFFKQGLKPLKGFNKAAYLVIPEKYPLARIDYSFQNKLANRIRLEFNPSKLGLQGLKELHGMLSSVTPNGWRMFVKDGRISRLDVAVDLVGVRISKLKIVPAKAAVSQTWSSAQGKLLTYQWGKPIGTHFQVYNKTA